MHAGCGGVGKLTHSFAEVLGLSATLPNVEDIATWQLGLDVGGSPPEPHQNIFVYICLSYAETYPQVNQYDRT